MLLSNWCLLINVCILSLNIKKYNKLFVRAYYPMARKVLPVVMVAVVQNLWWYVRRDDAVSYFEFYALGSNKLAVRRRATFK